MTTAIKRPTVTLKLTATDGKTGKAVAVPSGFDHCTIAITTNLPALKGPYFVDVLNDDESVYASVPIVASSFPIFDLPAPDTKTLSLRMERVAGLVVTAEAYASIIYYNWSEELTLPTKPLHTIIDNVPEVRFHNDQPVRTEIVGIPSIAINNTPVDIRDITDTVRQVEVVNDTLPVRDRVLQQPLWVTTQPFNQGVESRLMTSHYSIPYVKEVEDIISSCFQVQSGKYKPSLAAYQYTLQGKALYSINFEYTGELDADVDTVRYHTESLRHVGARLELIECRILYLQIGAQIVPKVGALYAYDATDYITGSIDNSNDTPGLVFDTNPNKLYKVTKAEPEMDRTANVEAQSVTSGELVAKTSNIVLGETQQESGDIASAQYSPRWHSLSTTELTSRYDNLCDRHMYWKSFTWKTVNQPEGKILLQATLPFDYVSSSGSYCNKPNFSMFNVHAFWRGDMVIKVQVNSNQFQSGMLLASWLYASDSYGRDDPAGPRYANVALMVQRPHAFIQAGDSNEAEIIVPYRYVTPFMRTKNLYPGTPAKMKALNMGTLTICPIVPLMTGTTPGAPTECGVSVFVNLPDSYFTGMVDGSIAKPEMLRSAPPLEEIDFEEEPALPEMDRVGRVIGATLGAVSKELGDINCDNPPSTRPAQFFVPLNAQSWSHGTNAYEPINTLRLNGGRIGVGRAPDVGYSDTQISKIVDVFGLLKPIEWKYADKVNNVAGKQIWGMSAHPQCDKDRLYVNTSQGLMDMYVLPPCGVVSSLYCYWRGSLQFKFQIVATTKHTGRLLVAYVPGIADYSKVTLDQAKSSAHVVFSLNTGTNSFTFDVPYIAETMWWQRKYGGAQRASDFLAPSCIVMFVVNPLVPMESVAQMVTILPFIAAGKDFEVAVPGQPAIGLALNRENVIPKADQLTFKAGYYPVYVGEWHSFIQGQKVIFRYGNTSEHVAQTTPAPRDPPGLARIYRPAEEIGVLFQTKIAGGRDSATGLEVKVVPQGSFKIGYAVAFARDGYNYLIPFPLTGDERGENAAKIVAAAVAKNQDLRNYTQYIGDWVADSDWIGDSNHNIPWDPLIFSIAQNYVARPEMERTPVIAREENPNPMTPTSYLPSTRNGVVTFGEGFADLKDLCRRYQLYWEGTVAPGQIRANKRNAAFVQIPVLPQGLKLDTTLDNPVWNSMREGHIPIVASGFRFYRGGVRMRIVVTGLNDSIWVQHHPDRPLTDSVVTIGSQIHDKDAYRNHGYGFHVQNLSVNRTIEIEIPYYRPGTMSLLGDPARDYDSQYYASLGDIVIGLEGDQSVNDPIDIAIYYTISDDCSFNHFVGFPSMVFCDEVFKQETPPKPPPSYASEQDFEFIAAPEMQRVPEVVALGSSFAGSALTSFLGTCLGNVAMQGTKALSKPIVGVVKQEVQANITPVLRDIESRVTEASSEISRALGKTLPQQAIINALGQFSQVALNPSPSAIAVAIASMCAQFVVVTMDMLLAIQQSLTTFLEKVWYKYFNPSNDPQAGGTRAQPEGFFDNINDKELNGFLGLLFTAVAGTVGATVAPLNKFPNIMKGVREALNVCNASVVFFRNIVDSIVYMYKYCLGATDEELRAKIIIEREYPHMKDWCNEVMELLDPRNQNVIRHSSKQANRVFDACMYGARLIRENIEVSMPGGRVIYDLYTKVCKLRDDLIELGNHPDVRFEPFPIWVCGPAGMGKSHMTNRVCKEMLQGINYSTKEMMIYWLSLGQKYWNGIGNNPVIARDEAYAVGGQFTEEEIATHLAICSSSILNPPMAALQEKNKRLNPLIYYMNSNCEFPQINEARHPEAIYRRRKLCIRAKYTADIMRRFPRLLDASLLSNEDVQDYKHLEFEIANDPKDPQTTWNGPYKFDELLHIVKTQFTDHIRKERINFRQRMRDAYALDPDYDESDQLDYIHQTTLPFESLHELHLRQREHAREILYTAPPTLDDETPWMQSIYERFSYLWTDCAMPEMPERERAGFYNDRTREMAEMITRNTQLNRGSIMKLLSGGMEFTDEEVNAFVIDPEFAELVKNKTVQMRFAIHHKDSYLSMLPEAFCTIWQKCGFDDTCVAGSAGFAKRIVPHWEDVSGVDSLRSYVYWIIRQCQYRMIVAELLKQQTKDQVLEQLLPFFAIKGIATTYQKLMRVRTAEELLEVTKCLDDLDITDARMINDIYMIIFYMNRVVDHNADFCEHCQFWVTYLHDTSKLEYSARQNTVLYYDSLGLRRRMDKFCTCNSAIASNPLFRNAMRIVWNHDHGTTSHACNPFAFESHRADRAIVDSWLARIWDYVKDWWRNVAQPFVSVILSFLYEHFGKIVVLLIGLYTLYNMYSKSGGNVAQTVSSTVGAAAETVAGSVVAGLLINRETSCGDKPTAAPAPASGETPESAYMKMGTAKAAHTHQPAQKEGDNLRSPLEILCDKIQNNSCYLRVSWTNKERHMETIQGRCLALRERQILIIKHYLEEFLSKPPDSKFLLTYYFNGIASCAFVSRTCLEKAKYFHANGQYDQCNYAVITLDKCLPMFKDITSSIALLAEHHLVRNEGYMVGMDNDTRKLTVQGPFELKAKKFLQIAGDDTVYAINNDVAYEYKLRGFGLCGSVLVSEGVCKGNPGIIGMHVAGCKKLGDGYSEPFYREMFNKPALQPALRYEPPRLLDPELSKVKLTSNLIVHGAVSKEMAHRESGKSKIVPSALHGKVYPVLTEPNPLRRNDPRQPPGSDPLIDGCNKHGIGMTEAFDEDLLKQVSDDNMRVLFTEVPCYLEKLRLLTEQEAICGTIHIPHCEPLNWNSSEGYPLSSWRDGKYNNKKYLFDLDLQEEGYILKGLHPKLLGLLTARQTDRDNNVVCPEIYVDCLKDYRLPPAKCKIPGKTRIFSIAPVAVTIDVRRFMGLFLSGYKTANVVGQHGIGINPDSYDWTRLANYLREVGDNIVTGDYSNFGPTLSSQVVAACIRDIIAWHKLYGASSAHITNLEQILENDILNPWHLCGDLVYQTLNGIASGSPITAELNSEVNKYYIKLAFLILNKQNGFKYTLLDFNNKVRLVTYGDDFIMSVHNELISWFNCQTIADALLQYNIKLTDAQKGNTITPFMPLEQSTFLKRSFARHPTRANIWLAPIEEQSITECINWCHRQSDLKAATEEVLRASCELAFGKGPAFYEAHVTRILKCALNEKLSFKYPTWKELDLRNFG
ncbi:polyprotein [Bat iflavirus]|uniref:polyprotein n=1 Tax=Bat iflavirus TaxID=1958778 RepID=UPI000983F22F|nr:polyprotein [Bat iflavirus]AQP31135.1 polyprotein [Bat iflavirus]